MLGRGDDGGVDPAKNGDSTRTFLDVKTRMAMTKDYYSLDKENLRPCSNCT